MQPFRVMVCMPSTGFIRSATAFSLARLVTYFAQCRVFPEVAEQSIDFRLLEGSGISSGRESLVEDALSRPDTTHVLFIDEDMGFNQDVLHTMARRRHPIVCANYRMRVPPSEFTALRIDKTGRMETSAQTSGLEEAYYAGFGFALIAREVFEKVEMPRFPIEWVPEAKSYTTEDHPFFRRAREAGFPCWIDHDASRGVYHVGNMLYRWDMDYTGLVQRPRTVGPTEKVEVSNGK